MGAEGLRTEAQEEKTLLDLTATTGVFSVKSRRRTVRSREEAGGSQAPVETVHARQAQFKWASVFDSCVNMHLFGDTFT